MTKRIRLTIANLERELSKLATGVRHGSTSCDEAMIEHQIQQLKEVFSDQWLENEAERHGK
jgi:hypothetical protein